MTIIKLIKHEGLNGQIWYKVYVNDSLEESFRNEDEAKGFYGQLIQRKKEGYPKNEIILSETLNELSDNIKELADDVHELSELKIKGLHQDVVSQNDLLIEQVKDNLKSSDISEKQKSYGEQLLKNLIP